MARSLALLGLLLLLSLSLPRSESAAVGPITDRHRSAAREVFVAKDGSFGSLEETYQALRTFQILGVDVGADVKKSTCALAGESLKSTATDLKDLFYALKVSRILGCNVDIKSLQDIISRLQAVVKDAASLLDLYYSIGSLLLLKEQGADIILADLSSVFHSIKALSQSDGRWRYDSNTADSSIFAAGLALEALAGVVSLSSDEVDQSMVGIVKNDIVKLFDNIKSYDDGSYYFDEEHVDVNKYQGPLSTSASIVRGLIAFASVSSGRITIEGDKIVGLAKFLLSVGIPGSSSDLYWQIESLSCLENNRVYVPLILSVPATVLSLSSKDLLKVKVTTVFGSPSPGLKVNLKKVSIADSKGNPVLANQELEFDSESSTHFYNIMSKDIDVGKYSLVFEVLLHDPEHSNTYVTGSRTEALVFFTGFIKVSQAEIAVLDSDVGNTVTKKTLDLSEANSLSLSANHLQKLHLSFKLTTPSGRSFKPHQTFLKLTHETKVEHIFLLDNSGKAFNIKLDFLGLVEKLYYLSGRYSVELTVGDAVMENSFLRSLGHVELDLPEPPEKASKPPVQAVDPYLRYGPKPEISHIFRAPEKRPPKELSLAFLALTVLPLLGFLITLMRMGVNAKNFPSSSVPAIYAVLFHVGIAAVLSLYVLFWVKLDLFTTLKFLGILGFFLVFVGHGLLSHLASSSTKLKSS